MVSRQSSTTDPAGGEAGAAAPRLRLAPEDRRALKAASNILRRLLGEYRGPVAVQLWNGERVVGSEGAPATLVFHHPAVLRRLILSRDLIDLGEAYLAGEVDLIGDMETGFDLVDHLQTRAPGRAARMRTLLDALSLVPHRRDEVPRLIRAEPAKRRNSRASIAHHYDVSNDFYRLWLDPEMVYSCAYFRTPGQPLEQAQRDKLDYICRKLRLQPGQRLLDIGCGWGALALWAARHYGVHAHGITLSEQQYRWARERIAREGLEGQVQVELRDYRELPDEAFYDRVVSVGMFEHVGVDNFPVYFGKVRRVLRPGGLFLNHGITNDTGWQDTAITRFINRYVFPDGELARISDVSGAMEQAGFELFDVENLRPHYALTCRSWVQRLERAHEQAAALTSEATYRLWRLYMSGSAHYFAQGSNQVYQVLAGLRYAPLTLPLRRDDLYVAGTGD